VSYDIYFVRRDPGQSFEDALADTEESFEGDPGPLSAVELELWDEVLPVARIVLGEVDEFRDETTRELSDRKSGIQLSLFNGEMAIHVSVAERDEESGDVLARVHALAQAVERVTGLEGYDPQLGEPVSDQPGGLAGSRRELDDDDDFDSESTGTSTSLPVIRTRRAKEPASAPDADQPSRRQWEFWKR
jgi:hypothetical protein